MIDSRWLLFVVLLAGCPKDVDPIPPTDSGTSDASDLGSAGDADMSADAADAGSSGIIGSRELTPEDGTSPDGAADIDSPLDAEARAGRYATADTGFTGLWSHCKQGDFKLYNDRVEACISNEISSRYETFAGGGLHDVRLIGQTGDDVFDFYIPHLSLNAAHPTTVRVLRDGSDGGPAIVRADGTDMPSSYLVGVAGANLFTPMELDVSIEYRLAPGDDFIEILMFVTNSTDGPKMVQKGDLIAWGDRADVYRQDTGFSTDLDRFHWIAAHGQGRAFAWATPDDELTSLIGGLGDPPYEINQTDSFVLEPGDSFAHFGRFVVGDSLDSVVRRARELTGESPAPARVLRVVDEAGSPAIGRRVEVWDGDVSLTGGTTNMDGRVPLSLPPGTFRLEVSAITGGTGFSGDVTVVDTDDELEVNVPTPGTIELTVSVDGEPSPAFVSIVGALGNYQGATWGERNRVVLAPGDWTVTLARGPEYDWVSQDITLVAGEVLEVSATLQRLIDTTDWIAGDFHQHMEPSSDSRVWVEDRVLDNAGQGVELVVPTDHDVVTDLGPVVAAAGLEGIMTTFPGAEMSPAPGHVNIYPVPQVWAAPGRGTVSLSEIVDGKPRRHPVPELIAAARQLATDPIVQLNHPRDSSGLLDYAGFDPELGPDVVTHPWFPTDFDAMEVSNGDECLQFRDWSGLWNAGVAPTPIGDSDSHGVWGSVGSKRTYLYAPGVEVPDLTAETARDIIRAGTVVVSTSVFLSFTDGTLPGATLDASAGFVDIGVRVQSANWVGVDELLVIVNGAVTQTIPVVPVDQTLDYEAVVTVPVTQDSWVTFFASGAATGTYRPTGTRPYSFNNAIRLDFDGNGYTSPGVGPLDLATVPLCE